MEIDATEGVLDWLVEARADWHLQATVGFVGCVSPSLDQHLCDDHERVAELLTLSEGARSRLTPYTPIIPKDLLNSFGTGGPGSEFVSDVEPEALLPVADAFTALLHGQIPWDAATSPVL